MANERILIVDDEARFRRSIALVLQGHDYAVKQSATGTAAIEDFGKFNPQVVLLDLMLPDIDGLSVCNELRRISDVAILVLSVVGDERTKIRALDEGADDYLTKPFGPDELLARIRAILRRSSPRSGAPTLFEVEGLKIDFDNHVVLLNSSEIHLTPLEFSLLKLFAMNPGKLLRHQRILNEVWGANDGDAQILRTYIKQLRSKLGDSFSNPHFIRTDPGLGYRFIEQPS